LKNVKCYWLESWPTAINGGKKELSHGLFFLLGTAGKIVCSISVKTFILFIYLFPPGGTKTKFIIDLEESFGRTFRYNNAKDSYMFFLCLSICNNACQSSGHFLYGKENDIRHLYFLYENKPCIVYNTSRKRLRIGTKICIRIIFLGKFKITLLNQYYWYDKTEVDS